MLPRLLPALLLLALTARVSASPIPEDDIAVLAAAAPSPPKGGAVIHSVAVDSPSVSTDGSGCRAGTVGVALSTDNNIMTFIFDDFNAAIGPNAGNTKKRALCKVNVTMSSPGWAFDVATVDFRGYVELGKGTDVSLVSRWKWVDQATNQDLKGKGNMQKKVSGPFMEDFLLHKSGEVSDTEASVCSKASARFQLTLSATLSATAASASGYVQGGSADAKFNEILGLSWRKC